MENESPSHEQLRSVLVHFPAKFLHDSTLIGLHSSDASSTWDPISHDDSLVILSNDHHLLVLWSRRTCSSSLVGLRYQPRLKVPYPRFVNSDYSTQGCLIFNVEYFFQQGCNVQAFLLLFSSQAVRNPSHRNFSPL